MPNKINTAVVEEFLRSKDYKFTSIEEVGLTIADWGRKRFYWKPYPDMDQLLFMGYYTNFKIPEKLKGTPQLREFVTRVNYSICVGCIEFDPRDGSDVRWRTCHDFEGIRPGTQGQILKDLLDIGQVTCDRMFAKIQKLADNPTYDIKKLVEEKTEKLSPDLDGVGLGDLLRILRECAEARGSKEHKVGGSKDTAKKNAPEPEELSPEGDQNADSTKDVTALKTRAVDIPADEVEYENTTLGEGGFGVVWKASWANEPVAVKVIRGDALVGKLLNSFRSEIAIMASVSHPCIVRFFGLTKKGNAKGIVMELVQGFDLYHYIFDEDSRSSLAKEWNNALKISFCKDVCSGLSFLHSLRIIHGDIKSLNILIEASKPRAKIADFGMSKMKNFSVSMGTYRTQARGSTPVYSSPELCRGELSTKADVWAFGVVVWELFTEDFPFLESMGGGVGALQQNIMNGMTLPLDRTGLTSDIQQLLPRLWRNDPAERPTFKELRALF